MRSRTTDGFWRLYWALPADVRVQARSAYRRFAADPRHPSLRFKQIHGSRRLVSVRVNLDYRAVGAKTEPDLVLWFWIGPHDEYERILDS